MVHIPLNAIWIFKNPIYLKSFCKWHNKMVLTYFASFDTLRMGKQLSRRKQSCKYQTLIKNFLELIGKHWFLNSGNTSPELWAYSRVSRSSLPPPCPPSTPLTQPRRFPQKQTRRTRWSSEDKAQEAIPIWTAAAATTTTLGHRLFPPWGKTAPQGPERDQGFSNVEAHSVLGQVRIEYFQIFPEPKITPKKILP